MIQTALFELRTELRRDLERRLRGPSVHEIQIHIALNVRALRVGRRSRQSVHRLVLQRGRRIDQVRLIEQVDAAVGDELQRVLVAGEQVGREARRGDVTPHVLPVLELVDRLQRVGRIELVYRPAAVGVAPQIEEARDLRQRIGD